MLAAVAVQTVGAQSFRDASEIAGFRAAPIRLSPNFAGVVAPRLARAGCDTAIPNPYLRDRTEDSYIITYQNNALRYLGYRLSSKKDAARYLENFFQTPEEGGIRYPQMEIINFQKKDTFSSGHCSTGVWLLLATLQIDRILDRVEAPIV
jgi:hypothetical protein